MIWTKITTKDTKVNSQKINIKKYRKDHDGLIGENTTMVSKPIPEQTNRVAKTVLDAAFRVHSALGPGLVESVYETCLAHELKGTGLKFEAQTSLPVIYNGITIETGLRLDILVEKIVIVEIKAVEMIIPIHKAQLLTYLKLSGVRVGLLININTVHLRDGIIRVIN